MKKIKQKFIQFTQSKFEDLKNRNLTLGKIYYDYKINFEQNSNILNELYKELSMFQLIKKILYLILIILLSI